MSQPSRQKGRLSFRQLSARRRSGGGWSSSSSYSSRRRASFSSYSPTSTSSRRYLYTTRRVFIISRFIPGHSMRTFTEDLLDTIILRFNIKLFEWNNMGVIRWFLYVFPYICFDFIIWSSLVPFRRSPPATSTSSRRRSYSAPTSYQPRRRAAVSSPRRRAARRRAAPPPAPVNTRRRSTSINGQTSLVNPCHEVTLRRHDLGGICKQMYKQHNKFIRINDFTMCEHKASAKSNSDFASLQAWILCDSI